MVAKVSVHLHPHCLETQKDQITDVDLMLATPHVIPIGVAAYTGIVAAQLLIAKDLVVTISVGRVQAHHHQVHHLRAHLHPAHHLRAHHLRAHLHPAHHLQAHHRLAHLRPAHLHPVHHRPAHLHPAHHLPSPPPPSPPPPSPPPPANPERPDHRCGPSTANNPCNPGRCCSSYGWCGSTYKYCSGAVCRYQCWGGERWIDLPRALLQHDNTTTSNNNVISNIISEPIFNEMFKHRKDCPSRGFYDYQSFVIAAASFSDFCTTGDVATRKRELAAFFAHTSQATTGEWTSTIDSYAWGLCFINRTAGDDDYCTSSHWSCASNKTYNSRGPFQLTHNYNYGLAGGAVGVDLINDPDLVATDSVVSFKTAIWYWMNQHDNNPSLHDMVINANSGTHNQVLPTYVNTNNASKNTVGYYKRYCDMLEVSYGDYLDYYLSDFPNASGIFMPVQI
ncbi:mulatexin [Cannabis sativa]|uniref:mulatexin n=1 Tax=Cannabis sativa TaxID=3483 RepID=UPI0029CA66BA|nr:mulatexin [Cannabis sativa]